LAGFDPPVGADLAAVAEVVLGVLLLIGWALVRRGHIKAHAFLQAFVVLVNLPIVLAWMVPSYLTNVAPGLPGELGERFYLVPTLMLGVGAAAEALGVYVILVAATNWVPEPWRFRRYKLVMRSLLGLWWSVLALGLLTFTVWYVPGASG
jgi:uncharacterized membrane protein YozB (DUF420 family)